MNNMSVSSRAISDKLEQDTSRLEQANARLLTLRSDLPEAEKKLKLSKASALFWGVKGTNFFGLEYDLHADKDKVSSIKSEISNINSEITALQTSIGNINAAMVAEENLDYRKAIDLFDQVGLGSEAKRIRKKMTDEGKVKVDQTVVHGDVVHGDYIDDRDTIVKDSVLNRSNVGVGGDGKFTKLKELTEMKEKVPDVEAGSTMGKLEKLIERRNVGEVTSEEFEEMKKEILERKPQVSKDPVEIAQEEAQGDYVDDRDTIEEEKVMLKEKEVTKEVPAVASPVFMEQLDQLQGTKNARLLMGDKVAAEVSISGLQEVLESRKDNGVNTLVMDGIITQRLIELVPKAGINIIVAEKKGPLSRDPVGITMFTREDLVKGSVVSKSNIGAGEKSKSEELREAKALLDDGIIDDDEFKQMKKDILGK